MPFLERFCTVFISFHMYFGDVLPNEPQDETGCCGFSVFFCSCTNRHIAALASLLLSTVKLSDSLLHISEDIYTVLLRI